MALRFTSVHWLTLVAAGAVGGVESAERAPIGRRAIGESDKRAYFVPCAVFINNEQAESAIERTSKRMNERTKE